MLGIILSIFSSQYLIELHVVGGVFYISDEKTEIQEEKRVLRDQVHPVCNQ